MDHPICLAMPNRVAPGSAWHEHIPFAMFLVDLFGPTLIVERGTHYGDPSCAFCQAAEELDPDILCYAVDTAEGHPDSGLYGKVTSEYLATMQEHQ